MMSTISDGQRGAHKGKICHRIPCWCAFHHSSPSPSSGEGARPGRTWKPSDVPVIDGGAVWLSYVRLEVEKPRSESYDTSDDQSG